MESKGTTVVASCIHQALTDSHRYTTLTDATPNLWRTSYHRRLTLRNQQLQKLCTRLWLSHTFTGVLQFGDCTPSLAEHLHIPHFGAAARR